MIRCCRAKSVRDTKLRQHRIGNAIPATETVCANDGSETGFYNRFQIVVQIEKQRVEIDQYCTDKDGAAGDAGTSGQCVQCVEAQQTGESKAVSVVFAGGNQVPSNTPALRFFCTLFHSNTCPFIAM